MSEETAVAVHDKTGVSALVALLQSKKSTIEQALPKHLTAERIMQVAKIAYMTTPALHTCSLHSIVDCVVGASKYGLEIDNMVGHAYLLPFKNSKTEQTEAQLILGYKGMMELARRSAEVVNIYAEVVRAKDKFKIKKGLLPDLIHEPLLEGDAGDIIGTYAVAHLKHGHPQYIYLPRIEIEKYRKRSKASGSGPWTTDYEAMAKKTAVRRLFTWIPMSVEDRRYLEDHAPEELEIIQTTGEIVPRGGTNDIDALVEQLTPKDDSPADR